MKRAVVTAFDDLDYAESKTLTPAECFDVPLRFGDQAVTLDLTQAHYDEIARVLSRFMAMGAKVTARSIDRRGYYREAREWADAHEIRYRFPSGDISYDRLKRLYDAHLAERASESPPSAGRAG